MEHQSTNAPTLGVLPDGLPDDYLKPSDAKRDPRILRLLSSEWGVTIYIRDRKKNGAMAAGAVIEITRTGKLQRISPSRVQKHLMDRSKAGAA